MERDAKHLYGPSLLRVNHLPMSSDYHDDATRALSDAVMSTHVVIHDHDLEMFFLNELPD